MSVGGRRPGGRRLVGWAEPAWQQTKKMAIPSVWRHDLNE